MGIGSTDLHVMLKMTLQGFIPGGCAVAEIGAQQLNDTFLAARPAIDRMGELFSAQGPCPLPLAAEIGSDRDRLAGAPLSRPFWKWLGLDYTAIDVDGSPDAVPLDLNFDETPDHLKGRFHFISNLGTTEHIINQMQAFKVIHDLTAVDGVMMHALPAQGVVNHGFFLYHPNFFFTLSRQNGYKVVYASLSNGRLVPYPEGTADFMAQYDPSMRKRYDGYAPMDAGITVCLQKLFDTPFVPALDVRPGSETDNPKLAERYWSVFGGAAFAELRAERIRTHEVARQEQMQAQIQLQDGIKRLNARGRAVQKRAEAIVAREQEAARKIHDRQHAAYEREQELARRELAVQERERAVFDREQVAAQREQVLAAWESNTGMVRRPVMADATADLTFSRKVRLWLRWKFIRLLGLQS